MIFKSASLFRFDGEMPHEHSLSDGLDSQEFTPCNARQLESYGWVPPMPGSEALLHSGVGFTLLKARREEKILPASVIAEHMQERIKAVEDREGRKVRGREKLSIRDDVVLELTGQAFVKSTYDQLLIMPNQGLLVVDNGSQNKVDQCTTLLRESLRSLRIKPVQTVISPDELFTRWLKGTRQLPVGVMLGDECVLQNEDDKGSTVRCKRQDLSSDKIRELSTDGNKVVKLSLEWQERMSFALDSDFVFSKIKQSDIEKPEDDADLDAAAKFDQDFTLMALELAALFPSVIETFGGHAEG